LQILVFSVYRVIGRKLHAITFAGRINGFIMRKLGQIFSPQQCLTREAPNQQLQSCWTAAHAREGQHQGQQHGMEKLELLDSSTSPSPHGSFSKDSSPLSCLPTQVSPNKASTESPSSNDSNSQDGQLPMLSKLMDTST
jgi:hypothetical protein